MTRREIKPKRPDQGIKPPEEPADVIEQLKKEHPVTARIATESIPRKPRD